MWEEFKFFIIVIMRNSLLLLCKSPLVYNRPRVLASK